MASSTCLVAVGGTREGLTVFVGDGWGGTFEMGTEVGVCSAFPIITGEQPASPGKNNNNMKAIFFMDDMFFFFFYTTRVDNASHSPSCLGWLVFASRPFKINLCTVLSAISFDQLNNLVTSRSCAAPTEAK